MNPPNPTELRLIREALDRIIERARACGDLETRIRAESDRVRVCRELETTEQTKP